MVTIQRELQRQQQSGAAAAASSGRDYDDGSTAYGGTAVETDAMSVGGATRADVDEE